MKRLEKLLPVGRSGALTARQLADLLETTPREVTRSIEAARRRGVPICASSDGADGGYYLAANEHELSGYLTRRERRTRNIQMGTAGLLKALKTMKENKKAPSAEQSPNNQHQG